jgi:hypothetical protein
MCDNLIAIVDGLYHCSIDEEDYHIECLNQPIVLESQNNWKSNNIIKSQKINELNEGISARISTKPFKAYTE